MKQLTCEMCGSVNLLKQDGVYVCQHCGTRYTVEEARKMMIEGTVEVQGTVQVDNSAYVEKYLVNARRAKQKEDWDETEKYYNMVEQNDPSNIEAIFYSAYGKAKRSLTDADVYKREAAFKVLKNCVSIIDDNFNYEHDEEQLKIVEQISQDILGMACSSYVYNQTKNGYGIVVKTDKFATVTMFNELGLAFTDSIDHIVAGYSSDAKHTQKKIALLKLALKHTEFILENGSLQNPAQVRSFIEGYHKQLHDLDPTHEVKTAREMEVDAMPAMSKSSGWGAFMSFFMIFFCLFPVTGLIISGIALMSAKKGEMLNINTKIAKITLIINIIATVLTIPFFAYVFMYM